MGLRVIVKRKIVRTQALWSRPRRTHVAVLAVSAELLAGAGVVRHVNDRRDFASDFAFAGLEEAGNIFERSMADQTN